MGMSLLVSTAYAQSHLGIEGACIAGNLPGNSAGGPSEILSQTRGPRLAPGGGIWADFRWSDYIDFQPHINITPKGAEIWQNGQNTGHVHVTYLDVPLRLMYRVPVGYDDFFFGGGVYGALGLRGTYQVSTNTLPMHDLGGDIQFNDPDGITGLHMKPWDAGYTAALSYQFSFGLTLHLDYEHGFVNIAPEGTGRIQNQGLSLGIGYLFHYNTRD
ncbi:outer membrane protein with beta-barrel domain [Dinghuibacter silviterrae]|uniref:Outer membrane protein with beta-barrel domain n=2 Tax=Dinghuibacter silviterrae TaxID=1539049 RepID=A0A4R8DS01_9BACT|nr:outer membrane protein with beta-barrel domain [Dinghuibacter silviterrae]